MCLTELVGNVTIHDLSPWVPKGSIKRFAGNLRIWDLTPRFASYQILKFLRLKGKIRPQVHAKMQGQRYVLLYVGGNFRQIHFNDQGRRDSRPDPLAFLGYGKNPVFCMHKLKQGK
jgi:hypothetical protein